jgi:hypothetical protein
LESVLVQQGVFHHNELYDARVIPRADDNPRFEQAFSLKASEVADNGKGFLDILFERTEPPVDPVTYLTFQVRSAESNTVYRWDLQTDVYLVGLLTRAVQTLLDGDVLKDGDRFRFCVSAHGQGRPRIDPIAVVRAPPPAAPLREQNVGEITVLPDDAAGEAGEEIEIVVEQVEELVKPTSKSIAAYADKEPIGQVSEHDVPIFMRRSAWKQAHQSANASLEVREEVGGFLLGNVFRDSETDRLFVEISEAVEADGAKGTGVSLDLDYGAWRQVLDRIDRDFPDKIPVGWYHTHLISQAVVLTVEGAENEYIAGYAPFFSAPDLFIHRNFFPDPWHVALVMDLRCGHDVFFAWREGDIRATHGFYLYGE